MTKAFWINPTWSHKYLLAMLMIYIFSGEDWAFIFDFPTLSEVPHKGEEKSKRTEKDKQIPAFGLFIGFVDSIMLSFSTLTILQIT